jgi:hypothetical protein
MNKYFLGSLQKERRLLAMLFSVLTVTYIAYSAFLWPQGNYYKLICKKYLREILNDALELLVECIVIIAILSLHRKTYEAPE